MKHFHAEHAAMCFLEINIIEIIIDFEINCKPFEEDESIATTLLLIPFCEQLH